MRGLQLPLTQTQKVRLQNALQQLESLSSKVNSDASVTVADSISVNHEEGVLKGHGTADINGDLVATLCGVVERVNKLVYVRALRSRYKPEVGDIVIGRVVEVSQKRWRLEINYTQDAVLMLSSMNMPDGVQRRRTAVDELNMHSIFEEKDVVCVEVRGKGPILWSSFTGMVKDSNRKPYYGYGYQKVSHRMTHNHSWLSSVGLNRLKEYLRTGDFVRAEKAMEEMKELKHPIPLSELSLFARMLKVTDNHYYLERLKEFLRTGNFIWAKEEIERLKQMNLPIPLSELSLFARMVKVTDNHSWISVPLSLLKDSLRVGFCVWTIEMIEHMKKRKLPIPLSELSLFARIVKNLNWDYAYVFLRFQHSYDSKSIGFQQRALKECLLRGDLEQSRIIIQELKQDKSPIPLSDLSSFARIVKNPNSY